MNNKKLIALISITLLIGLSVYFGMPTQDQSPVEPSLILGAEAADKVIGEQELVANQSSPENHHPVSREECFTLFDKNQTPDSLLQQKNNYLIMFFRELQSKKYDVFQLDVIADVAGLNKKEAFSAAIGNQAQERDPKQHEVLLADNYDQQTDLPSDQRDLFDALVEKRDLPGLVNAFHNKTLNPTNIRFGDSLLAHIIAHTPQISVSQIQSLLAAGTEIHLDTIVAAVKFASSDVVIFLAENYTQALGGHWEINDMPTNLTMASAAAFRDDLFFYFMSKGVSPYVDNGYEYSMLFDVMPEPVTEDQKKRALNYVVEALKNNARSTRLSSIERLKRWLPEDIQQSYRSSLMPAIEIPAELMELGVQLKNELEQLQAQIITAQKLASACQRQHGYSAEIYLEELLQGSVDSTTLSLATKNLLAKHVDDLLKKAWEKAVETELKKIDPAELGNLEENKLAHKKLFNQIMDKQWDKALGICSGHPHHDLREQLCAQLLHSYVRDEQANWAFIEKILPNISQLNSSLITPLVMHNKIDLLRKFAARGLPFDQLNHQQDPLAWALRMGNNTESIVFLLAQGTPTKYDFPGPDALDTGLAQLDRFNASMKRDDGSPYFSTPQDIALLIKAGAPIERSHIEKIQQLKTLNPDAYQALITAVPELAAY